MTRSRAPSWSWASVDGEINFPNTMGGAKLKFADVWESSEPAADKNSLNEIKSIRTDAVCLPFNIKCSSGNVKSIEVTGLRFPTEGVDEIDSRGSFSISKTQSTNSWYWQDMVRLCFYLCSSQATSCTVLRWPKSVESVHIVELVQSNSH